MGREHSESEDAIDGGGDEGHEIEVTFYGCRGSVPVCAKGYHEFGGNTTCVLLSAEDSERVGILDAGTGIRRLGQRIMADEQLREKPITIAFTHFHWDHIQGLPFFEPAYVAGKKISLLALGRARPIDDLERVFARPMQQEYFPVQLAQMGAAFEYLLPQDDTHVFPKSVVTARQHAHPGSAYTYRVVKGRKSVVFCTDIVVGDSIDSWIVALSRGADLLIHDSQYTPVELPERRGWGHSSYEQAIECARLAGVKRLVLTHHDPDHDDAFLREIERKCQDLFPNCTLAREGMVIRV
jgi:phosphoribosyl 1,2-cyclic phosphodiesterase